MEDDRLREANDRLRPLAIQLLARGKTTKFISLRATLPNKPGQPEGRSQQTIALRLPFTIAGINRAETIARKVASERDLNQFNWENYLKTPQKTDQTPSHTEAIERYQSDYLARGGRLDTWKKEYGRFFDQLTGLSEDELKTVIFTTEPDTRNRKRAVIAMTALSNFLNLGFNFSPYRGNYSPYTSIVERTIPTDTAIEAAYEQIPNPAWKWVYGMLAAYGLRNHELFRLNLQDFPIVQVRLDTKSSFHDVLPCPKKWVDKWALQNFNFPPLNLDRTNHGLGEAVSRQFDRYKLPFRPYDLRHAWAIRTLAKGWPLELSARMMGHSVDVHTRVYQKWINRETILAIYQKLMQDEP